MDLGQGIAQAGQAVGAGIALGAHGRATRDQQSLQSIFHLQSMEPEQQAQVIPDMIRLGHLPADRGQELLGQAMQLSHENEKDMTDITNPSGESEQEKAKNASAALTRLSLREAKRKGNVMSAMQTQLKFQVAQQAQMEAQKDLQQEQGLKQILGTFERANNLQDPKIRKQAMLRAMDVAHKMIDPQSHKTGETSQTHDDVADAINRMDPENMRLFIAGVNAEIQSGRVSAKEILQGIYFPQDPLAPLEGIQRFIQSGQEAVGAATLEGHGITPPATQAGQAPAAPLQPSPGPLPATPAPVPTGPPPSPIQMQQVQTLQGQLQESQGRLRQLQIGMQTTKDPKRIEQIQKDLDREQGNFRQLQKEMFDIQRLPEKDKSAVQGHTATDPAQISMEQEFGGLPLDKQPAPMRTKINKESMNRVSQIAYAGAKARTEGGVAGIGEENIDKLIDMVGQYKRSPSGLARNPALQARVMAGVADRYPDYREGDFAAGNAIIKDFASGPRSKTVQSINAVAQHTDVFRQAIEALGKGDNIRFRQLTQRYALETGEAAPTDAAFIGKILAKEITKVIVPGGGGVEERQEILDDFNRIHSPEQLLSVMRRADQLMQGQVEALRNLYTGPGTGKTNAQFEGLFHKKVREKYFGEAGTELEKPSQPMKEVLKGQTNFANELVKSARERFKQK